MSALTNDLKKLTEAAENTAAGEAGFRQKFPSDAAGRMAE